MLESGVRHTVPDEEQERTLYIRLSHKIKNEDEIRNLVSDYEKIKLPRQSSRSCHVIFKCSEDKMVNLHALQNKTVNGKQIFASLPKKLSGNRDIKLKKAKKIIIHKKKLEVTVTRKLFVSGIPCGTTVSELKKAFPGCTSAAFLKNIDGKKMKRAIVKMESLDLASRYLTNCRKWPKIKDRIVKVLSDTRKLKTNNNKSKT